MTRQGGSLNYEEQTVDVKMLHVIKILDYCANIILIALNLWFIKLDFLVL